MAQATMLFTRCLNEAPPKMETRGSFWIELALWLLFCAPGLIYSLWRLTTKRKVCPNCGAEDLIPPSSPRARQLKSAAGS